jgi:hypothetical protein
MSINYSPSNNSDNFTASGVTSTQGIADSAGPQTAVNQSDPSAVRLAGAGLVSGASNALQDIAGRVFNFDFKAANGTPLAPEVDWRVRISMQPAAASLFYSNPNNPIMYPLVATNGLVFPYTPTVAMTHTARYGSSALTHSNYQSYFYEGSEVQSITISGEFTVQNIAEGQYLMAAIQYMRACTKMFFGGSALAGTPPPMVFLDGYGPAYLPHVPCVVTNFTHTMPSDVDYIDIPVGVSLQNVSGNQIVASNFAARTRMPTMSTLSITLQPVYSRNNIAKNFTLEKFNAGALVEGSTSNKGGFL